jgi:hypothetical protein
MTDIDNLMLRHTHYPIRTAGISIAPRIIEITRNPFFHALITYQPDPSLLWVWYSRARYS